MKRLARVRLNHARRIGRLGGPSLALGAALIATAGLATYAFQLADAAAQLQAQVLARQDRAMRAAPRVAPVHADPAAVADDREAARIRSELALPWERMFDAIESAASPDISLLLLTPAPARAQLTLGGEARNMAALLAFLKRLQGSGGYARAYLREHHIDPADAQQAVRFSIELKWNDTHG